ncbi:MAG TPA: hypothetical protein VHJ17_22935 [Thermomonospora sp.]|nr:hypothetical protein [Thermomonospora sp.]
MPIDARELFRTLAVLGLPAEHYVVAGSAPLLVHGLRATIQDVDVVARGPAWKAVLAQGTAHRAPFDGVRSVFLADGAVEVLDGWFPERLDWRIDRLIAEAEVIKGHRFLSLRRTLEWKAALCRPKDAEDLRVLREVLCDTG